MSMVKMRIEIERRIARAFIKQTLAAGYGVSVDNGAEGETTVYKSVNVILRHMFATDEERLYIWSNKEPPTDIPDRIGWVYFVYGNDGWDVISDYTTNLEHLMTEANKISEKYSG